MQEPNYIFEISKELNLKEIQISNCLNLVNEGSTVPFIARYRKELTNNLDETQIRDIIELKEKKEALYKAKIAAITGIEKLGKLTKELEMSIISAKTLKEVEEIYKPYKLKKKTKAMIAIEKGFQVTADMIKNQQDLIIPQELLDKYPKEEIIEGSIFIVSQEIVDSSVNRDDLREYLLNEGTIHSKQKTKLDNLNEKDKSQIYKFEIYKDFSISIPKIKPYQTLALNRGENLNILKISIEKDNESYDILKNNVIKKKNNIEYLEMALNEAYITLFKSVVIEVRNIISELAEAEAIKTFQTNLGDLLITKPETGKNILAIDPGFRTGSKIAILDKLGDPIDFSKIYLSDETGAIKTIKDLLKKYKIDCIVIGNGTASKETSELLKKHIDIEMIIVNESGASVYSASEVGKEEFPSLDITDRGTISIGRRYMDPLGELVKINPESIGVGMYQHDINKKELEKKLGFVVEDVVNNIGINVNTASVHLLNHISGLNKKTAKKVYENRPYRSRNEIKKILSSKSFEQAAGFLRVPDSKEKFDNTNIHPEQYELANFVITNNITSNNFYSYKDECSTIYPDVTLDTISFINNAYEKIGEDPRIHSGHLKIEKSISIETLKEGDIISGIVRNIVQFGVFVDIGLKNDGLIHISEIANEYVKDPSEFVDIGEQIKVKVMKIDLNTNKIQLSLRQV